MAVPKKRTSSSKQGSRRSHLALEPKSTVACPNCAKPTRPHMVCANCGQYRGRQVVKAKA